MQNQNKKIERWLVRCEFARENDKNKRISEFLKYLSRKFG